MRMFVQAHLGKETQMVTRSEKSTPQTSQYVKDLIGDDFEKFIHAPNAYVCPCPYARTCACPARLSQANTHA